MKTSIRIAVLALCAALILALPFTVSSPAMLGEAKWMVLEDMESGEEAEDEDAWDELARLLFPSARAEEITEYALPVDFSVPPAPDASLFTEAGYEDDSIRVQMETREEGSVIYRIAWVEVASPTQLRTATAGKLTSEKTALVKSMAVKNNAVVALNGDYFANNPTKTSFEYRMGQKIRAKGNKTKDILIIDENGDFHTFVKSQGAVDFEKETGHQIVNAFTFGPALVQEGNVLKMDTGYGYNPNGREPRAAIGQLAELSYVLVVAEGRGESVGVTHQELADFMGTLNCVEAYNLDGGGTAAMVYNGEYFNRLGGSERATSDIIYFATAVPEE